MSSILDDEDEVMDVIGQTTFEDKIKSVMLDYPKNEPGKDAFGHQLQAGDYVIYTCGNSGISGTKIHKATLLLGKVKKICPKRISVDTYLEAIYGTWGTNAKMFNGKKVEVYNSKIECHKLIKIDNIDEFIKDL